MIPKMLMMATMMKSLALSTLEEDDAAAVVENLRPLLKE